MRMVLLAAVAATLWWLSARPNLVPQKSEITSQDVRDAIEHGVSFLKSSQKDDGSWPDRPGYAGGLTPLCALALLHAGCGLDDVALSKALANLRLFKPNATYAASLQVMALCAATPKRDLALISRNVKFLESRQIQDGTSSGMWARQVVGSPDHIDNSMTHLAMLALYEAERVGVPVSEKTWRLAVDYWKRSQNPDGSWGWGGKVSRQRQHDLRRHCLPKYRSRSTKRRRLARRAGPGGLLRRNAIRRTDRSGLGLARAQFHRQPQSGYAVLALVLPVQPRACRSADRATLHRQPRLVPRGCQRARQSAAPRRGMAYGHGSRISRRCECLDQLFDDVSGESPSAGPIGPIEARAGRRLESPPEGAESIGGSRRNCLGA